jgi:hypothetical protein
MDESTTRRQIEEHADAVVRGDMDTVIGEFSDDLRPSGSSDRAMIVFGEPIG